MPLLLAACAAGTPDAAGDSPTQSPPAYLPAGQTLAASSTPDPGEAAPSPSPVPPSAAERSSATLTPTPVPPPLTRYRLDIEFDYTHQQARVDQQIDYVNRTGEPIPDLVLVVEPARYASVFTLESISWQDGPSVEGVDRSTKGQLRFPLPEPLAPGGHARLALAYTLDLPVFETSPNDRPVIFGYTERQTNLVDWYPFVPPYLPGQGWLVHPAGAYGEHLVFESADFEVHLHMGEGAAGLMVAASALPDPGSDAEWLHYQMPSARNFAISISPYYKLLTGQAGGITVESYVFPIHAAAGQKVLEVTLQALELYQELFGPYPRPGMTVVEADFLDGMEYDGLYFLSYGFYNLYTGAAGDYLVAIAAHETAHQWWYGLVGNDQALEPWLDEALSTYCERLYFERIAPEGLAWWWDSRVNFYTPDGWVDSSIYNPQDDPQPYTAYRDAVYLFGAIYLEELRAATGDEAFFAFLKDYAKRYSYRIATRDNFFTVLREHTPVDLTALQAKYFSEK
jgi:hypothetical protein